MPNYRSFFKGRFVTALDFDEDRTLTIGRIDGDNIEDPEGLKGDKWRGVVSWREDVRPWVMSKTAAICLAAMYGSDETDDWVGKRVTLFHDPNVRVSGKKVGGIRVRGMPGLRPMTVNIKLPKRKGVDVRLVDTGRGQDTQQSNAAPMDWDGFRKALGDRYDAVERWHVEGKGKCTLRELDRRHYGELMDYINTPEGRAAVVKYEE